MSLFGSRRWFGGLLNASRKIMTSKVEPSRSSSSSHERVLVEIVERDVVEDECTERRVKRSPIEYLIDEFER